MISSRKRNLFSASLAFETTLQLSRRRLNLYQPHGFYAAWAGRMPRNRILWQLGIICDPVETDRKVETFGKFEPPPSGFEMFIPHTRVARFERSPPFLKRMKLETPREGMGRFQHHATPVLKTEGRRSAGRTPIVWSVHITGQAPQGVKISITFAKTRCAGPVDVCSDDVFSHDGAAPPARPYHR